jgi:hypothetical protein
MDTTKQEPVKPAQTNLVSLPRSVVISGALLIAILAGTGGFFAGKGANQTLLPRSAPSTMAHALLTPSVPTGRRQAKTDPITANRKVYVNTSFSFKYPATWEPVPQGDAGVVDFFLVGQPHTDPGALHSGNATMELETHPYEDPALLWKNLHDVADFPPYKTMEDTIIAGKQARIDPSRIVFVWYGINTNHVLSIATDNEHLKEVISTLTFTESSTAEHNQQTPEPTQSL